MLYQEFNVGSLQWFHTTGATNRYASAILIREPIANSMISITGAMPTMNSKKKINNHKDRGSSRFFPAAKVKALKEYLKSWNKGFQVIWQFARNVLSRVVVFGTRRRGEGSTSVELEARELALQKYCYYAGFGGNILEAKVQGVAVRGR